MMNRNTMKRTMILTMLLTGIVPVLLAEKPSKSLPHVLVIGIDGLGAHGMMMSKTPH